MSDEDHVGSNGADEPSGREWESVAAPASPRRTRAGVVALCSVISLGVGTVAFVAGRATAPTSLAAGASPGDAAPITQASAEPTVAPAPDTLPAVAAEGSATTAVATQQFDTWPANGDEPFAAVEASSPSLGFGLLNEGAYEEPAIPLLAERTTASGIVLRAHVQNEGGGVTPVTVGSDGWQPEPWCNPSGYLRVTISTSTAVNVSGGPWYSEPKDGLAVSTMAAGYAEGTPVFALAVQAAVDASNVTMLTADGRTDSGAPTGGLALLAVDGPIARDFTVVVTMADGTEVSTTSADMVGTSDGETWMSMCQPPMTLPAPGEQPAEAAAVEEGIRATHETLYSGIRQPGAGEIYIDDMNGIADAVARLDSGPYAGNAATARRVITGFVFTSPTEAWFSYDIVTDNVTFGGRFGRVHPSEAGVWQFTRQSICQDLALAPGAECDPPVATLYPPRA